MWAFISKSFTRAGIQQIRSLRAHGGRDCEIDQMVSINYAHKHSSCMERFHFTSEAPLLWFWFKRILRDAPWCQICVLDCVRHDQYAAFCPKRLELFGTFGLFSSCCNCIRVFDDSHAHRAAQYADCNYGRQLPGHSGLCHLCRVLMHYYGTWQAPLHFALTFLQDRALRVSVMMRAQILLVRDSITNNTYLIAGVCSTCGHSLSRT